MFKLKHGSLADHQLRTKAKLRKLTEPTLIVYSRAIAKSIFLILWCIHVAQCSGQIPGECSPETRTIFQTIQSLQFIWRCITIEQKKATISLYTYLFSSDTWDPKILLQLLHDLFVSLVKHSLKAGRRWACLTDYSLFLGSIFLDGTFQSANNLTKECAALQHTFFVILLHDARLEGKNPFTPFQEGHWRNSLLGRTIELNAVSLEEDTLENLELEGIAVEIDEEVAADVPQTADSLEVDSSLEEVEKDSRGEKIVTI